MKKENWKKEEGMKKKNYKKKRRMGKCEWEENRRYKIANEKRRKGEFE